MRSSGQRYLLFCQSKAPAVAHPSQPCQNPHRPSYPCVSKQRAWIHLVRLVQVSRVRCPAALLGTPLLAWLPAGFTLTGEQHGSLNCKRSPRRSSESVGSYSQGRILVFAFPAMVRISSGSQARESSNPLFLPEVLFIDDFRVEKH